MGEPHHTVACRPQVLETNNSCMRCGTLFRHSTRLLWGGLHGNLAWQKGPQCNIAACPCTAAAASSLHMVLELHFPRPYCIKLNPCLHSCASPLNLQLYVRSRLTWQSEGMRVSSTHSYIMLCCSPLCCKPRYCHQSRSNWWTIGKVILPRSLRRHKDSAWQPFLQYTFLCSRFY